MRTDGEKSTKRSKEELHHTFRGKIQIRCSKFKLAIHSIKNIHGCPSIYIRTTTTNRKKKSGHPSLQNEGVIILY